MQRDWNNFYQLTKNSPTKGYFTSWQKKSFLSVLNIVVLEQKLAAGDTAALEAFWQEVTEHGTPMFEAVEGNNSHYPVTFRYLWLRARKSGCTLPQWYERLAARIHLLAPEESHVGGHNIFPCACSLQLPEWLQAQAPKLR